MYYLYSIILVLFSAFSYNLVDPNITFINHPAWTEFRNFMVYWGYYRREVTSIIYIVFVILLFGVHFLLIKQSDKFSAKKLAFITSLVLLFSYPLLSHDFFNYMFDAKIFTYYHQNPYLKKALDFPKDPWIRFMHWTHRTYPYGPVFLALSLIPSFLGFGKFLPSYILFKLFFISAYLLSVWLLNKTSRRLAITFATHPLVIIEGLINSHNDLIGVALAIAGLYYLERKNHILGRVLLLLSGGIKYLTTPLIIISGKSKIRWLVLSSTILILGWLSFRQEIQPWYFLTLFAFLPIFQGIIDRSNLFLMGLTFSYYPYIRFGGWDSNEKVALKHTIIIIFAAANLLYFFYLAFRGRRARIFRSKRSASKS